MEMPGQRRLTRRYFTDLQTKGLNHLNPINNLNMFSGVSTSASVAAAQPALQSAPGSLAEQAAQMEQFGGGFGRKSTEEIFIQSFVDSSSKGVFPSPSPIPENMGLLQASELEKFGRGDSEELFSSWISTTMANHQERISRLMQTNSMLESVNCLSPLDELHQQAGKIIESTEPNTEPKTGTPSPLHPQRTRMETRRISGELAAIIKQQSNFNTMSINGYQRVDSLDCAFMQAKSFLTDNERIFETTTKSRGRNSSSKQASSAPNAFDESEVVQKLWYNSAMPMTRSKSSELRRKVAELKEIVPTQMAIDSNFMNIISRPLAFSDPTAGKGWPVTQQPLRLSDTTPPTQISDPSSSHSPPLNTSLSDYVGMLRGSLNKAKQKSGTLLGRIDTGNGIGGGGSSEPFMSDMKGKKVQVSIVNGDYDTSPPSIFDSSSVKIKNNNGMKWQMKVSEQTAFANGGAVLKDESYLQPNTMVTQLSDSSEGAPNSGGFGLGNEVPCVPGPLHAPGRTKTLKRTHANVEHLSAEPISVADLDAVEQHGSLKNQENQPKNGEALTRMGSINSTVRSGGHPEVIDDATKKRRVDRQRKMAVAKGRGATAVHTLPPDMQTALKRLENLEVELRSLKMTLQFMNRKDSDQTKKIEELEEQNRELRSMLENSNSQLT